MSCFGQKTLVVIILLTFIGCGSEKIETDTTGGMAVDVNNPNYEKALFAGGCFWCMEKPFMELPGVIQVISGYTGGQVDKPTYDEVSSGNTGHREAVEITFDPTKISYYEIVDVFWKQIDPTDSGGQFNDRGEQYQSAIYYLSAQQKELAEKSKQKLQESGHFDKPIVTDIIPGGKFYPAEEYHQDYYKKNPVQYQFYRFGSGRDNFLRKVWGEKVD